MPDETVFFAFAAGRKLGPMTRAELDELAARGDVGPDDLVWKAGTPEWLRAAAYLPAAAPFPEAEEAPVLEASGIRPLPASPPPPPEPDADAVPRVAGPVEAPPLPATAAARPGVRALLRRLLDELRSVRPGDVLPLARLRDPEALGAPAAILLLVFGAGPLALATVVEEPALRSRLFALSLGGAWGSFFVLSFVLRRPSARLGAAVFLSCALLAALLATVLPDPLPLWGLGSPSGPPRAFPLRLLAQVPGAALAESGKGLLLLLLARVAGGFSGPADGLSHGLLAGLGYGIWEAASVTAWGAPHGGAEIVFSTGAVSPGLYAFVVTSIVTTSALPLLHAAWSGAVGHAAGLASAGGAKAGALLLAGLVPATLLHSIWKTSLATGAGFPALLTAVASLLLLLACRRNAERRLEGSAA